MKTFRYTFQYIYFPLLFISLLLLSSCGHSNEPIIDTPTKNEKASRTVLVYMVANNSLGSGGYDASDLAEMQQAAASGHLGSGRLIVYHSPRKGTPMLKEVTNSGIDTLKVYDADVVSVSIDHMTQVIADAKESAPAEDYGLVLWSHALGWLQDGIVETRTAGMTYSYGLDNGKKMNITSLAQALDGQGFSFVYFDCCFMGSVEVMYELRKSTPYIIASPAEDRVDGMPYHKTLKHLFANPIDLEGAAKATFDHQMLSYSKYECPITLSVVKTDGLDRLAQITREIYSRVEESKPAGYSPQQLAEDRLCYYYDLADYIEAICDDAEMLKEWQSALSSVVTYKDNAPWIWGTIPLERYCGLSTYILMSENSANTKGYNELSWYADVASVFFE